MNRPAQNVPVQGPYTVRSAQITYSAEARAELAGTTATVWDVLAADGHSVGSGYRTEADAQAALDERARGEVPVVVPLVDGTTALIAHRELEDFAGLSAEGYRLHRAPWHEDECFPTTPCCNASGTGSGSGVACRGCYRPVDDVFGWILPLAVAVVRTCDECGAENEQPCRIGCEGVTEILPVMPTA